MLLFELFGTGAPFGDEPMAVGNELREMLLDILTPLAAQKVPFITVQQIIDKLRDFRTGIALDRGFVMDALNPDTMKVVKSIEGDRIYLNVGGAPEQAQNVDQEQKDDQKIGKDAAKQAQQDIAGKAQPPAGAEGGAL